MERLLCSPPSFQIKALQAQGSNQRLWKLTRTCVREWSFQMIFVVNTRLSDDVHNQPPMPHQIIPCLHWICSASAANEMCNASHLHWSSSLAKGSQSRSYGFWKFSLMYWFVDRCEKYLARKICKILKYSSCEFCSSSSSGNIIHSDITISNIII